MGRSIVMHIDEAPRTKGGPYKPGSGPIPRATQLIGDLDKGPWVHIHCLEPNLVVSPHTHDQDEVAFIVEGELTIEGRKCGPGTVLFNEKDTEYGFTVGGPVVVPNVYDGRNKTFFHFAFSQFKFRGASRTSLLTVPTEAFRNGDFSSLVDGAGNQIPIFDPVCDRGLATEHFCTGTEPRAQFPGNIIPSNLISPLSQQLIPLIPSGTSSANVDNLLTGVPSLPT